MTLFVVGSLHLDVVVRAPRLPGADETVAGNGVEYMFGGKGGNQALAASRLGARVALAGRVGRDGFGDMIRAKLETSSLDSSRLQMDDGPSGMSVAIVDARGEYGAVIVSASNLNIEAEQMKLPDDTALLLLQNEVPERVNLSVASAAKDLGARVWLNAAPARDLSEALLSKVDLLIVNRVEADFYRSTAHSTPLLKTLGADGVEYNDTLWPAFAVDVISTHGAGDMFVGALAARVADGASIENAILFAQAAAAWHVSTPTMIRDATSRDELLLRLNRQLNA